MLQRKRLAQVSDRRKADNWQYLKARQQAFDRAGGECEAASVFPDIPCAGRVDPHHVRPQSRYPELRCDPDNIRCICRRHHDYAHLHPLEAKEAGLLR